MSAADRPGALRVWQAANRVRGKPPSPERVRRVSEKLSEPEAVAYVTVGGDASIIAMAVLQPRRADDGAGPVVERQLHLSMFFVDPAHQRNGVGTRLLDEIVDRAREGGFTTVSLWTGESNEAARALYTAAGMRVTGRRRVEPKVDWVRYELSMESL